MSRRVVVDWGFNVVPFDPQTRRRNFWGAVFGGGLTATATAAALWFAGREGLHIQSAPGELLGDFWEAARGEPVAGALASLAALLGGLAGGWTFWETFKPREIGIRHMRGRRYLDGREAIDMAQQLARAESKASSQGVPLSQDFHFSAERETTHTLIVVGVGAGKTTIAHHILGGIFDRNDHALIVDWKGDFTAAYPGRLFNPLDARSMRWCVAQDVTSELDAQAFAAQIIPDPSGSGDPFWANAARSVLTALVIKCQQSRPGAWTWGDLYGEVVAGLENIQQAVGKYYAHALPNIAEAGKQTQGVISQIVAQFDGIRVLAEAERDNPEAEGFSVRRWLNKSSRHQIILAGSTEHERLCRGYMSAVITCASAQIQALEDSKARRVWLVADEAPKLGKVEAIPKLLAFGRSKGARVVLLAQDLAQLRHIYGADETKALIAMVGTIIIGRTQGGETADTLAKQVIGTREVERRNITHQGNGASSAGWQRDELLVVHPSELQTELGKRSDHINALIVGLGDYVLNVPWHFVAPAPSRPPMVWRDCFQGKAKPIKTVVTVEQLTQTHAQTQQAEQEAGELPEPVEHAMTDALPHEIGLIFEGLHVGELLSNKGSTPTANATHNGQRLKRDNEQEEEQEQGD